MNTTRTTVRRLTTAVVLMFAGVLALVLVLSKVAGIVSSTDNDITGDYAPSVVALDSMLADIRKIQTLLNQRALGSTRESSVRDIQISTLRRQLEQDARTFFALPVDPGEATLVRAVASSLERFDGTVDRLLAARPGTADAGLLADNEDARSDLVDDIVQATDFNADLAEKAAMTSHRVARTLIPTAAALGVASVFASAAVIALAYRSVLRAERLSEESRQTLERRAEELEAFAGRVAHDLLSPLASVGLALDLAERRVGSDVPHTITVLRRASMTLQRVGRFVADLLDFARAGAAPVLGARADVDEIVREVAEEFAPIAEESAVALEVEQAPHSFVSCSPGVLSSLVSNLVQNAIKYLGDAQLRRVAIRAFDLGSEVRVEVEDSGPGIAPSEQERLFEPYARGRDATAPGLGLGLATVRRLAERHGGHAGVRSELGLGAVFWVTLPVFR